MARSWYVRDRGREMGPLSVEQLLDMRDRGQIQSYHEVSTDRRTWRAFDLAFPADKGSSRPEPAPPNVRAPRGRPAPSPRGNRTFAIVIGSVVAVILVCGIAVGIFLIARGKPGSDSGTTDGATPEGVVSFASTTPTRERDLVLADTVALVVPGVRLTFHDGSWAEERFGHGSGYAVSPNGHIITNRHVVEELVNFNNSELKQTLGKKIGGSVEGKMWVFFGREDKCEAEVLYVSDDYDLAILKASRKSKRHFALSKTEDSRIPMLDSVSSIGFPSTDQKAMEILNPNKPSTSAKGARIQHGFQDPDFNITKENGGIKKNSFRAKPDAKMREANYLVHTARIATGNSGGPLIARDGTVLGINTLGISVQMGKERVIQEGQNYALTLPQLRKEIDQHVPGIVWRDAPE